MKIIHLLFALCFSVLLHAQSEFNTEGLSVSRTELEQNVFSKDSTANALVIYETGNTYVDKYDFKIYHTVHRKLKILNRDGFNKATEQVVLYNTDSGRREVIDNIKATVYNLEGDEVVMSKLDEATIIEEKFDDNHTLIKFTFPNVKPGCIITYSYQTVSPFFYKYQPWNFQKDIPVLYSEYITSIPGMYDYNIKLVGGRKLYINESNIKYTCIDMPRGGSANCLESRYVMKDIPAFIEEEYMTTSSNHIARVEYEIKTIRSFDGTVEHITKSWVDTNMEIRKTTELGRMYFKTAMVKDLIDDTELAGKNDLEKVKYIYDYVRNNFNSNKERKLLYNLSQKKLLQNKTGAPAEINMLLLNLLRVHDIDAKILLLSTRNNGFITRIYPVMTDFNYMLAHVKIDGKVYLLDANDEYISFGQIPYQCLNQYGRLFDMKKGSVWHDFSPQQSSSMNYRGEMQLGKDAIKGSFEMRNSDYLASFFKEIYFSDPDLFVDNAINSKPDIEISNINLNNLKKTDSLLKFNFDVSKPLEVIGNKIYLNPFIVDFNDENPFKLQERSYPVDFGFKQSYGYATKINFGDHYVIEELPKPVKISLPQNAGSLIASYQANDNSVTVFFKVSFSKAIYDPSFYESLKELMNVFIDVQKNTFIVFSKKE